MLAMLYVVVFYFKTFTFLAYCSTLPFLLYIILQDLGVVIVEESLYFLKMNFLRRDKKVLRAD